MSLVYDLSSPPTIKGSGDWFIYKYKSIGKNHLHRVSASVKVLLFFFPENGKWDHIIISRTINQIFVCIKAAKGKEAVNEIDEKLAALGKALDISKDQMRSKYFVVALSSHILLAIKYKMESCRIYTSKLLS